MIPQIHALDLSVIMARRTLIQDDWRLNYQVHDPFARLYIITDSEGGMRLRDQDIALTTGDMVLVQAGHSL